MSVMWTAPGIADRIETAQLGLANRLLGRAREVIAMSEGRTGAELGVMAERLANALHDALLIAEDRGSSGRGREHVRRDEIRLG